jgi:hypothetical protein
MIFSKFLYDSAEKGILSLFNELNTNPDIQLVLKGKDDHINEVNLYQIENKYFDDNILIKYNTINKVYYISHYSDLRPQKSDDVVSYINSNLDTKVLIHKNLEAILDDIEYYDKQLKEFGETKPLMEISDIQMLNQVYNALKMPNKIDVNENEPYSTWMISRFFVVDNVDEIKKWIKSQIKLIDKE